MYFPNQRIYEHFKVILWRKEESSESLVKLALNWRLNSGHPRVFPGTTAHDCIQPFHRHWWEWVFILKNCFKIYRQSKDPVVHRSCVHVVDQLDMRNNQVHFRVTYSTQAPSPSTPSICIGAWAACRIAKKKTSFLFLLPTIWKLNPPNTFIPEKMA